jgi:hypothetical protein
MKISDAENKENKSNSKWKNVLGGSFQGQSSKLSQKRFI